MPHNYYLCFCQETTTKKDVHSTRFFFQTSSGRPACHFFYPASSFLSTSSLVHTWPYHEISRFQSLSDADECESSPCKQNGKCHVSGSSYTCDCTAHWEGYTCNSKYSNMSHNSVMNRKIESHDAEAYSMQTNFRGVYCKNAKLIGYLTNSKQSHSDFRAKLCYAANNWKWWLILWRSMEGSLSQAPRSVPDSGAVRALVNWLASQSSQPVSALRQKTGIHLPGFAA